MFPTSLVLSALAFSAVMADSVAVNYPHVPLMFWSKQPTLNKQQTYVNAVVNEQDTLTVMHSVLTHDTSKDPYNVLSHDAKKEPTAEALCVFVYENLQSAQLSELSANAYVQKAIQTATSSVVIAHTTRSDSLNKELETIEHTPLAIDDVAEWVQSAEGKKLLTNGKPDLLVVHIPDDTTKDISKKMKTMDAKIEAAATALLASKQPIDFALTGNAATPVVVKDLFARRSRRLAQNTTTTASIICDVDYHIGMAKNGKAFCFTHYVHITPEILTALLFGFFFLFLAYVGISVLHGIQTPQRYPLHGPPKGKEF